MKKALSLLESPQNAIINQMDKNKKKRFSFIVKILIIVMLVSGLVVLTVIANSRNSTPDKTDEYISIEREIKSGVAYLFDVRTVEEFDKGHINGAVSFPLQSLQSARYPELAKDSKIYVYSNNGKRSTSAKAILEKANYQEVINLGSYTKILEMGGELTAK